MCGINGFTFEDKKLIKQMNTTLSHRGPDDQGTYTDKWVSLGQRRLSIIDLSKHGKNPMTTECVHCQDRWITFNGEIYNFKELRKDLEQQGHQFFSQTDTEVVLHLYEEYGPNCLQYLNGMFAFCIYDPSKKTLFIARDRMGIKPLYYHHKARAKPKDRQLIFSSEIKSILEHAGEEADQIKRKICVPAMHQFFTYRYVREHQTIFKDIYRLEAGHYLLYNLRKQQLIKKQYWDINTDPSRIETGPNKLENLHRGKILDLLMDAVGKRLISDVPLGAYLSGGIDSSAIVGCMAKIAQEQGNDPGNIKTFSVGFARGEKVNELTQAKQMSELMGTEHHEFMINPNVIEILPKLAWHFDEPFADPAAVPVYELSRNAKKHVTVVLTGDGGDEIFGGYDQYKFLLKRKQWQWLPSMVRGGIIGNMIKATPLSVLDNFYKYSSDTGNQLKERFAKFISTNSDAKAYDEVVSIFDADERKELFGSTITKYKQKDALYFPGKHLGKKQPPIHQFMYYDAKHLLPEGYLMKTDRTTMAWGIEARVPLLDHRIVQYSFRTHPHLKIKGKETKYILKQALHKLLPKHVLNRGKQTFHVPIDQWIQHDLMKDFQYLLDPKERGHNLFNQKYIDTIFRKFNQSRLFYARQLWSLANFQLWHKIYIQQDNALLKKVKSRK